MMNYCWYPYIKKYPDTKAGIFLFEADESEYEANILNGSQAIAISDFAG